MSYEIKDRIYVYVICLMSITSTIILITQSIFLILLGAFEQ